MIRILIFLLVILAVVLGFTWLAERPGELLLTFNGYEYRLTLMVAAVTIAVIVASVMIVWWVIKGIWNSPRAVSRFFRVRRRDRGYQALSTGLIAAGAGDAAKAKQMRKQAVKLISSDQEPLVHLLDAQTAMLEGEHEAARQKFEAMLDDPEMRLLGLRGLFLEAERHGDRVASRHYAGRATALAPQLAWASDATLEEKIEQGDWDGALRIVESQKATKQIARDTMTRRKAVMFTGKAQAVFDTQPDHAKAAAVEANRLQPEFVPAAIWAARAYFRQDDLKRGSKILEHIWKRKPHPQIGEVYVQARHGNSTHDRLTRARKLAALKPNNAESSLVVARAALAAGEYKEARREAEAALKMEPREGIYLLLADIEEADGRDQGRIRQYLSQAVRAPRDPVWVADGFVSEDWAPVSPVTGRLDAFEWKVPVERVAQVIDNRDRVSDKELLPALPYPLDDDELDAVEEAPTVTEAPRPPAAVEPEVVATPTVETKPEIAEPPMAPKPDPTPAVPSPAPKQPTPVIDRTKEPRPAERPIELRRLPDDPGVDDGDDSVKTENSRFRLF